MNSLTAQCLKLFRGKLLFSWLLFAGTAAAHVPPGAKVQITDLHDVTALWDGHSTVQFDVRHCVASQTRRYQVKLWGSGENGAFALHSPTGATPFRVAYADSHGHFEQAHAGAPIPAQSTPDRNGRNGCEASMTIRITLDADALSRARAGEYGGELFVTVTPDEP